MGLPEAHAFVRKLIRNMKDVKRGAGSTEAGAGREKGCGQTFEDWRAGMELLSSL